MYTLHFNEFYICIRIENFNIEILPRLTKPSVTMTLYKNSTKMYLILKCI